jgi:plastocyanin
MGATVRTATPRLCIVPTVLLAAATLLAGASSLLFVTTLAQPAGASSKPPVVKALETDFHIALSKHAFVPGKYTFDAENKGHVTHSLEITGPGLKHPPKTKNLAPGQSAKLTVTFKTGTYDVYCPIPGHKALGMNLNLRVRSAPNTSPHM